MNSVRFEKWQKFVCLFCIAGILGSLFLLLPIIQNLVLDFGEILKKKPLDNAVWVRRLRVLGAQFCVLFMLALIFFCFFPFSKFFKENIFELLKNPPKSLKTKINEIPKIGIIALIIFFVLNIIAIIFHEHWLDESISWLMMKQNTILRVFEKMLPKEGHPCLWYLFITPFVKLGFPYDGFSFLSFAIVFIATIIFFKEYEIPIFAKIVVLFSPVLFYFMPVIVRSYSLLTLELICIGAFYGKRKQMPILWGIIISAMLQTHIYLAGLSGMLLLQMLYDFIKEKDKETKLKIFAGGLLGACNIILLLVELSDRESNNVETLLMLKQTPMLAMKNTFTFIYSCFEFNLGFLSIVFVVLLALIFIYAIFNFKIFWQEILIIFGAFAVICGIVFVYIGGHMSHKVAIFSITLCCVYLLIKKVEPKKLKNIFSAVLLAMLLFSCRLSLDWTIRDIRGNFSNSKAIANYMNENQNQEFVIIPKKGYDFVPIIPYYKNDSYSLEFDFASENIKDNVIYVFLNQICENDNLELIHTEVSDEMVFELKAYFYKRKSS